MPNRVPGLRGAGVGGGVRQDITVSIEQSFFSRCIADICNILCFLRIRTNVENIIVVTCSGNRKVVIVRAIRIILCHLYSRPCCKRVTRIGPYVHVQVIPAFLLLKANPERPRLGIPPGAGGTADFFAIDRNRLHIVACELHIQKGNGFLRNCHLNRMFRRIIGDIRTVTLDLAERVGIDPGLRKLYVLKRKFTGSTIGYCRSDIRVSAAFQLELELEVRQPLLPYAVLDQCLGAGNVQFRCGRYNLSLRVAQNQAAVGHNAAAMNAGTVAGDNDPRGADCLALGGVIWVCS